MLYIPFQGLNFSVWIYIEGIILIVTYSLEHDLNTGPGGCIFFSLNAKSGNTSVYV